jgi:Leucine-rich repeat (LRR) protein
MILGLQNLGITSLNGIFLDDNLEKLYLGDNKIKEIDRLSSLINLHYLYMWNNEINDIKGLSSLTNLRELFLSYNQIKDITELSSLTNLQKLYLSHNKIKEICGLSSLTNLQLLTLDNNEVKDIENLNTLTNLQTLALFNNQIPDYDDKKIKLLQRNIEISWKVVKPQFIRYCFTLAPLNLPVDILIMIFDVNSYPNHLFKKWEIAKTIKDAYQRKIEK